MHVHFVCTGNTFRSRLSEAYFASLCKPNQKILVSSSGINAANDRLLNGPINWYTMRLLQQERLVPFMSFDATQTTAELLAKADLVVFIKTEHLEYAKTHLDYQNNNYQVWNIPDLNEMPDFGSNDEINIKLTEIIFNQIKQKAKELIQTLKIDRVQ